LNLKLEKYRISIKLTQHSFGMVLLIALASRIIIIITSIIVVSSIGIRDVADWRVEVPLAGTFAHWDSAYYLTIAQDGYVQRKLYAFRPLYPLLLRALATLLNRIDWQTMTIIGFIVNNLFFFISSFFLYRLTELAFTKKEAYRTVVLFSFLPGTVYLLAIYPEALYLALLFASLYYLYKSKVFTAALFSFFATLTRPEGIVVSVIFLMIALQYILVGQGRLCEERIFYYLLAIMLQMAGVIAFGLYVGDIMQPFYSELMWDKWSLEKFIGIWWLTEPDGPPVALSYIVLLLLFCAFIKARKMIKARNLRSYYVWSLLLIILFLVYADFRSLPRLTLQIVPAYWILANSSYWRDILIMLIPLAMYGAILYVSLYPIL
jgi:phosphatidylinositol glycan class V